MSMYYLMCYSNNDSKTCGGFWQNYRDEPITNNASVITDFPANDNTDLSNFKQKLTGQTGDDTTITTDVEIMVPLKYVSNFWRTLKMLPINLILDWTANCVIASHTAANQATRFAITDTKLYVPALTLSNDDNAKI